MVSEELKERRCEECFHYGACRRLVEGGNEVLVLCEHFCSQRDAFIISGVLQEHENYMLIALPCNGCGRFNAALREVMLRECVQNCTAIGCQVYSEGEWEEEVQRKRERRTEDQACPGAGDA